MIVESQLAANTGCRQNINWPSLGIICLRALGSIE